MQIEPAVIQFIGRLAGEQAPYLDPGCGLSHAERRAAMAASQQRHLSELAYPEFADVSVTELEISHDGQPVPLRLFTPKGEGPRPAYLFFFGGGFWQRSFDGPDIVSACRQAASEAGVLVVEIDYPLAPEHPYPAALEAGVAALRYLVDNADHLGIRADRIAVGGQSSGGNLAAAVVRHAHDHGGPAIARQVLEVPALDLTGAHLAQLPGQEAGPFPAEFVELLSLYQVFGRETDPCVSPLLAPDFSGLPPALVLCSEFDPLRGDAQAYVAALQAAGVPAVGVSYAGQIHATPALGPISPSARAWRAQVSDYLRQLHR
ncbi:MAG: alpha/beta hydrolase [Propionibacteriaceae bacterium]|nr:alpha/beta hydrolase [Propionibacteriaceae bacterium]